jgi:hypothetical protein
MDPQAAWNELLAAYDRLDWDEVETLAQGLLDWLRRDGFPPRIVGTHAAAQKWNRAVVRFAAELALSDAQQYSQISCPF